MDTCRHCGSPLPRGARFCPGCGSPSAEAPSPAVEERKLATVLFADLVGSTALGEREDPERTRALLERFYDAMAEEIERAGGTVEKFAGDAVMAAFGAPTAQEDHGERALHAALALQRRMRELFGDDLELRIGVNTGQVVVGRPREGSSFVTGDAVNVAARLEQAAAGSEILVGERTVRAAQAAFEFGERRMVEARGKSEPIACRPLVSARRRRRDGRARRPFVGRELELELLRGAYSRALSEAAPQLVLVLGEAGVGKSRLVRELWTWLERRPERPTLRVGRCLSYGTGITYWPVREILLEQLGLSDDTAGDEVRKRLGERAILGLALGLDTGVDLHPLAARDRFREAWVDLLGEAAAERPLALLVEDVHWAEEPLLELLERTIRDVREPLLVVATARPDVDWSGGRHRLATIELEPLARAEAAQLVADFPADVRDFLLDRAEGNPFFVEEIAESLIDRGLLAHADGGWRAALGGDRLSTPDSIRGVLAARIDLLPPPEKAALQAAAVIGRTFWEGPVRELAGDADFALLEERDFIRRHPSSRLAGEREHSIKHALTREAAYSGIPKARRAHLHAAFARWVERRREGSDELAPILAHHYAEAVRPEDADLAWTGREDELAPLRAKAVEWLRRGAERAMQRYELDDALALLERARALSTTREERVAVLRATGRAHALNFAGEPFWEAMQAAIENADDPLVRAELYAEIAFESAIRSGIWQRMPARETVDDWVDRALAGAPSDSRARGMALIARARWDPEHGAAAAIEASSIAERLDDAELRSAAWDSRGIVAFVAGEFDLGRAWAERRFELLDRITDPDLRADIYSAPISGCIWSGRFAEARRLARAHDEIASALTPHHRVHAVAIDVEVEELLGRWDLIAALEQRVEDAVAESLETPCVRNPRSLLVCAAARELAGDAARARALEQRALELWMDGYGLTLDAPRIRLALARANLADVERLLGLPDTSHGWHRGWFVFANVAAQLDALAELRRRDEIEAVATPYLRRRSYLEPFALRALGRVREDEGLLRQALERFEAWRLDSHAAETRRLLGDGRPAT